MKKDEKVSSKLTCFDLINKVLGNRANGEDRRDGPLSLENAIRQIVEDKTSGTECAILFRRYNLHAYDDSSVSGIAEEFSVTEAEIRKYEAKAIKRLREPDCFSFFVKNFGSKEVMASQINKIFGETIPLFEKYGLGGYTMLSDVELTRILEMEQEKFEIFKKYIDKYPALLQKTPPLIIADLGFSVRAANALRCNCITSVEKLCAETERYLLKSPRIGKVIVKEIKDALAKHGLSLAR